jgi:isocitrate lyase
MLSTRQIATFQEELGSLDHRYQFVRLAGFPSLNAGTCQLARDYSHTGMTAYARLQEHEFALDASGAYSAIRHQPFVGAGYFDHAVTEALTGSTEAQFRPLNGNRQRQEANPGTAAAD